MSRIFLVIALLSSTAVIGVRGEPEGETLLSTANAYNPIPSPNGKMIAYVLTGWGRGAIGGLGRASLISEVSVLNRDGSVLTQTPLADTFLAGWSMDGRSLVCYRDWKYELVSLNGKILLQGNLPFSLYSGSSTERVFYLPKTHEIAWSWNSGPVETTSQGPNQFMTKRTYDETVIGTLAHIVSKHPGWLGEDVIPSPNDRYLAIFDEERPGNLFIYDIQSTDWFDLGPLTIHPDVEGWSSMKASWNPWFSDSSRLAYASGTDIVISKPDGSARRTISLNREIGLPTPSPNGKAVAYLTFVPRPRKQSPDLKFWGGTIIWALPLVPNSKSIRVTQENEDATYDLRWLDNSNVVFDRFEDEPFPIHIRIWRASVNLKQKKPS
jgi:hypothetical protein